jgi:hypothetical protein
MEDGLECMQMYLYAHTRIKGNVGCLIFGLIKNVTLVA